MEATPAPSTVLWAEPSLSGATLWVAGLGESLADRRMTVCRTRGRRETLGAIETGRLDAAVLAGDGRDELSILEDIRSIQRSLPCVLVTAEATSRMLHRALALEAYSVLTQPVQVQLLTDLLVRIVFGDLRIPWALQ